MLELFCFFCPCGSKYWETLQNIIWETVLKDSLKIFLSLNTLYICFRFWLLLCLYFPEIYGFFFLGKVIFRSILTFINFCFENVESNWYCFNILWMSYFSLSKAYISCLFFKVIRTSKFFKCMLISTLVTSSQNICN